MTSSFSDLDDPTDYRNHLLLIHTIYNSHVGEAKNWVILPHTVYNYMKQNRQTKGKRHKPDHFVLFQVKQETINFRPLMCFKSFRCNLIFSACFLRNLYECIIEQGYHVMHVLDRLLLCSIKIYKMYMYLFFFDHF